MRPLRSLLLAMWSLGAVQTATLAPVAPRVRKPEPVPVAPLQPAPHLSDADLDDLARELDAIRDAAMADLGEADAAYIRRVIATQRQLEVAGRVLLLFARRRPALVGGTALLAAAKVLENMEIGHNV
ncbi:MAG: acyl-CoA desaturase, partial [Solirubrobacteraceae bacterium]